MHISELDYFYPEQLVATERAAKSRVMWFESGEPSEIRDGISGLLEKFRAGDLLVLNDTKVLYRRVFSVSEPALEILFLNSNEERDVWQVLCPSSRWKSGTRLELPDNVTLDLTARGRPQTVRSSRPLLESYFEKHGDLPLPPYIQKARGERRNRDTDRASYQTAWAERDGSLAAPTASLHFSQDDLKTLREKGVEIETITLHVGIGTFLPITVDEIDDHLMHAEIAQVKQTTWRAIQNTKATGNRVWALGTTVTRTLESIAQNKLSRTEDGDFFGETDLFIRPGFQYQIVDVLMTNFHQPRSTLLSLVAAFTDLATVKRCYAWAIDREFKLFSYGDLSVWTQ